MMNELKENSKSYDETDQTSNERVSINDFTFVGNENGIPVPSPTETGLLESTIHPKTPSTHSPDVDPHPTSSENKSKFTSKNLTLTLSNIYALFVLTLGVIIYTGDFFYRGSFSPVYSLVLLFIGFAYLVYLIADINVDKCKQNKLKNSSNLHEEKTENIELELNNVNEDCISESNRSHLLPPPSPVTSYQFSHGRHSGSFYLKLGATGFAIGHLIHSVLLIATQLHYYMDDNIYNDECLKKMEALHDICNPLFCFLQLYFIFNYSNVVILKHPWLANLGFIHLMASSICFWISTIYSETLLALLIYANAKYGANDSRANYSEKEVSDRSLLDLEDLYNENCTGNSAIIMIFENFSPYLYPFGVEFHILIVAFYYIIWSNIGHPINEDHGPTNKNHLENQTIEEGTKRDSSIGNVVVHVDCHHSSKGLFFGLVFVVITAAIIILGFVFGNLGGSFIESGYAVKNHTKLWMHFLMIVAVVIAYTQSRSLDVNEHPISILDDVFLYICLPAFFMETLLSLVATINILNVVRSVDFILTTLQVIIQTIFIVDGLRRCSNSRKLRRHKPGRDAVMFLLIANVCMWLFNTFSYKSPESVDERYEYYGKVLWTILGHITLPLMMFYRFHSSVCLADIWDSVYKPASDH